MPHETGTVTVWTREMALGQQLCMLVLYICISCFAAKLLITYPKPQYKEC